MSRERTVVVTLTIEGLPQRPDENWKICVRPSDIIAEKDSAGRLYLSFCQNEDNREIGGSLVLKPPASSGPPGDTESARKDTPQDEPAENTLLDLSWLRSTLERELVQSVVQVYDRQRTRDGLTWSEVFSIARQVLSAKLKSASPP
jgi:hypothetical protein